MRRSLPLYALVLLSTGAPLFAVIENIKVLTDNTPDLHTLPDYVRSLSAPYATDAQKAEMSYKWQAWLHHEESDSRENGTIVRDVMKTYNNYLHVLCDNSAEIHMRVLRDMGYTVQRIGLGGHVVMQVQYGGAFHMYDAAFGFFSRSNADGHVLSNDEIRADLSMTTHHSPSSTYPGLSGLSTYIHSKTNQVEMAEFAPATYTTQSTAGPALYLLKVNLRPGEYYSRTWLTLGASSDYYTNCRTGNVDPNTPGGPFARSNGEWRFTPDLSPAAFPECVLSQQNIETGAVPRLRPSLIGDTAAAVFRVDPAHVIASAMVGGSFHRASANDLVRLMLSVDNGATWSEIWRHSSTGPQTAQVNIKPQTAMKYGYRVKVQMVAAANKADAGVDSLTLSTVTMINPRSLPRLNLGVNRVMLKLGAQPSTAKFRPIEVTYCWKEFRAGGPVIRSHSELVGDSAAAHEYYINIGGDRAPDMQFMRINFQGYSPDGPAPACGYSDAEDVGTGYERPSYFFDYGLRNLAYQKGYTSAPAPTNDASRTRLTDGTTSENRPPAYGLCAKWAAAANPEITVRLGAAATGVGGIRLTEALDSTSAQYADSVVVSTSEDSMNWTRRGAIVEQDLWFPPVNDVWSSYWDSPAYRHLKYHALFRYRYSLAFDSAVQAKYVRLKVHNSAPVGLLELEIHEKMARIPAPDIVDHGFTLSPVGAEAATLSRASALSALTVAPNPSASGFSIRAPHRADGTLRIYNVRGVLVRDLSGGNGREWAWDGKDRSGRRVPAGLYLFRAFGGGLRMETKALKM